MKKIPHPKTIRGKIISITATITLLITIITVCICFSVFQSFLKKNQIQSAEFNLQLIANSVSTDIKEIIYLSKWCCSNRDIISYLEAFQNKEPLAQASKENRALRQVAISSYDLLKEEYLRTGPSKKYISRLIIANNNSNNLLQLTDTSASSFPFTTLQLLEKDFYSKLYDSSDYEWIGIVDDPYISGRSQPIIPIVRPIYDSHSTTAIGWNYLSISPSIITDYLKSYPLATDSILYLSIGNQFYAIIDYQLIPTTPDFTILSDYDDNSFDVNTKVQTVQFSDGSKRTLIIRAIDDGWYFYQILSEQQLQEQRQIYFLLIIVICLIILSLGFVLMTMLNRTISQPVILVKEKIDAIAHGDFSSDPAIEWEHEIGDIGKGINHLSREVVTLMDKRIDDEKNKKDLEYQILQSQINPHFLYNTLNSIKWMATIQGSSGIAEMTTALARLMKSIAKGTSTLVTLQEELDLVKNYFVIQQYRYGGSITLDYEIESDDLYHCQIHRFSLQPIIENALFHGIEPKGSAGKILIAAKAVISDEQKNLQISITDNGIGMTPEMIQNVLYQPAAAKTSTDFFKQVGINNVNQRIQYDFGPDYGITINSVPGQYTTMVILIPYIKENISYD